MPTHQPELDYLFPRSKPNIRLKDLPAKMGLSLDTVWKLYLDGQISGNSHHTDGHAARVRGTTAESRYRYTRTVTRESVIAYMIRTSDYDQPMVLQWAKEIADRLTPQQLIDLASHCHRLAQNQNSNLNS